MRIVHIKDEQYEDIKRKINEFHGIDNAASEVVIFGNPCTMQIISRHWTDEIINSPAKKVNAPLIEMYTGVEDYKAKEDQIEAVMKHITAENYLKMRQRVRAMVSDDTISGGSNFGGFIDWLEKGDYGWIRDINFRLETDKSI